MYIYFSGKVYHRVKYWLRIRLIRVVKTGPDVSMNSDSEEKARLGIEVMFILGQLLFHKELKFGSSFSIFFIET